MSQASGTSPSRSRILVAIILGLAGAALVAIIVTHFFPAHDIGHLPLLAELPRAGLIYSGMELAMDGAPAERFYLVNGFAEPNTSDDAMDKWCRDVLCRFQLHFVRWQLQDITLRLRLAPLADTRQITVSTNGTKGQSIYLEPGYHDVSFPLANNALLPGDNLIEFNLTGGRTPGAVIDSITWLIGGDQVNGTRVNADNRSHDGRTMPVLGTSNSAEINFYAEVPVGARLLLGLGHDLSDLSSSPGTLSIYGHSENGVEKTLWQGDFPRNGIRNLNLDMGGLAGSLSLLSFCIKPNPAQEDWLYISEPRIEYPRNTSASLTDSPSIKDTGKQHPHTIVLICEDALRRDMLPIYGREVISTPNLDGIAGTGLVFENAYSPSAWTKHVFASIYTAQPGGVHGAIHHISMLRDDVPSLVELFQQNHWHTAIITSNPYTSTEFKLNRGFSDLVYLGQAELETMRRNGGKVFAGQYIPYLEQWLDTLTPDENAFLVMHLMDTHVPYHPPPGFMEQYYGKLDDILKGLNREAGYLPRELYDQLLRQFTEYCGSITYFDSQLPVIMEALRKAGRAEGATYVLFADHGEEFLDHNGIKHGFTLFQEMIHVPLIMWGEGVAPGRSKEFVNLEDLMPTLLDMAGIQIPAGLEGSSFAGLLDGTDAGWNRRQFAETEQNPPSQISIVWQGFKLIHKANRSEPDLFAKNMQNGTSLPTNAIYELYNLADDPKEWKDMAAQNPIRVEYYTGFLRQWWMAAHRGKSGETHIANLSPATIEIFKGLGYVQ